MRLKKLAMTAVCAAIGISVMQVGAGAQTTVLYNGALDAGSDTPISAAQGSWLGYAAPAIAGSPTTSSSGGSTTLDTTIGNIPEPPAPQPYSDEAGYSNYTITGAKVSSPNPFPTLNPTPGFTFSFDVNIATETHASNDRAGFAVIALGSDMKGVELDFWSNDVWAQQNSGTTFTHDPNEDADTQGGTTFASTFTTSAAAGTFNDYQLSIQGTSYSLMDNGATILTGQTHDYTGSAMLPYTLANYVFVGDDSMNGEARESFSYLAVTVPEPATGMGLIVIGSAMLARRKR